MIFFRETLRRGAGSLPGGDPGQVYRSDRAGASARPVGSNSYRRGTEPAPYRSPGAILLFGSLLLALPSPASADDGLGRISNFSARAVAGSGAQTLTVGFAVAGGGNTYLLRGIGPTLASFGVPGALADPWLHLHSSATRLMSNNNWGGAFIAPRVGAFALPADSLDAAILAALDGGSYTMQIGTGGSPGGIALAEIYDTRTTSARLTNLSARAQVGTGDAALWCGFAISGTAPRTLLLRAIGPSLAAFNVNGALGNPKLEIFEAGQLAPCAVNDNAGSADLLRSAAAQSGAFPLPPESLDAAMLLALPPGTYTARVSGVGDTMGIALFEMYDEPVSLFPLSRATNVVYRHGDVMKYTNRGEYAHADGSKTIITGGWLRLEVFDQGLHNPLNDNLPVLSLVETLLYEGAYVAPNGASMPVRVVGFPTTRYFVQDENGSIKYQGDRLPEGTDSTGAPIFHTYWFATDYIQYAAPFVVGALKTSPFTRNDLDRGVQKRATMVTKIEGIETATSPLGRFSTYRVRYTGTGNDPDNNGVVVDSHTQNVYPDIGIVRFDFASTAPGDTGVNTMTLSETNLPYLGGNVFPLVIDLVPHPPTAGHFSKYDRSGFYLASDGTVEEISGWMTRELKDEGVMNPVSNRRVLTAVETHDTAIEATTLAGVVTRTHRREVIRKYLEAPAPGPIAYVGETSAAGTTVWFDQPFIPLAASAVGQTASQAIQASTVTAGTLAPAYSFTSTARALSAEVVRARLGSFGCYRIAYTDAAGIQTEQYLYPPIGIVKFSSPAPVGKFGHMDLTLSSTNIAFP